MENFPPVDPATTVELESTVTWEVPRTMQTPDTESTTDHEAAAGTLRVCLTGATGFIGTHLAKKLKARGHEVRCLVRATSKTAALESLGAELRQGDVTDVESLRTAVADADVVFHLAGTIKAVNAEGYARVNEHGTAAVAKACAEQKKPPVLVIVSSLAAAGPAEEVDALRVESDAVSPVSNYGRSKYAGELAAAEYADRVPMTVIRPPIVFGEGDPETFHMIRPIARVGIHVTPSLRARRFSLIHADDLCEAMILAAEKGERVDPQRPISGVGRYYVSHDVHPTYGELGRLIGSALERRRTWVVPTPEWLTWTAAAAAQCKVWVTGKPTILNLDKAREATAGSWTCSAEKAQRDLGFRPAASLAARLRQTIGWYRGEGWL